MRSAVYWTVFILVIVNAVWVSVYVMDNYYMQAAVAMGVLGVFRLGHYAADLAGAAGKSVAGYLYDTKCTEPVEDEDYGD